MSRLLIDTLVDLHAVDIQREGLAHLGKPAGFVERQVRGWTKRWHRARTTEVPEMDAAVEWLTAHLPSDPRRPSIVHGDFRLDNVMLDREGLDRVVAVFDWEMTALGDPLVDLGILLVYWGSAPASPSSDARTSIMQRPGWFTREDILERYAARSGRDVSGVRFYEILACFKVAVVVQQIFFRYVRGQTDDPRFRQFDARVASLARRAAALMEAQ